MVEVPDSLTEAQLSELQALLEQKQLEVKEGLRDVSAEALPVALDELIGEIPPEDALGQQRMAAARKQRLEAIGQQLSSALGRVRRGEYGECMRCEEPVGYERLMVRPEALLCRTCQEATGR